MVLFVIHNGSKTGAVLDMNKSVANPPIDRSTDTQEVVLHDRRIYRPPVAADYRLWARKREEILVNNREGTRLLMQAALAAGVERVVYTSSVATLACAANGGSADETMRLSESCAIGAYKQSKVAADRVVETLIGREHLPAIIVHPTAPIGPRDQKPTPTGRVIIEAASGRIPGFVDTGLNLVHVDDVASGHLAALRFGKPGDHYILGGQNVLLAEFLGQIAVMCGRPPPKIRLPRPLLYLPLRHRGGGHGACDAARAVPDHRWIAHVETLSRSAQGGFGVVSRQWQLR